MEDQPPDELTKQQKYYRSVFNKFDKNKSGGIELCELVEMLHHDDQVPKKISKKIFKMADKDSNGVLSFEEFDKMVQDDGYSEVFSNYINLYINYVLPKQKNKAKMETDALYEEKYSCFPPPLALILITFLELIFFIIDEYTKQPNSYIGGYTSDIFIYNPYKRNEAWRYLSYMFVHIGYMHLIVNLIVQLTLGLPLEMVHSSKRVLAVYFSGVIAGSLCTSIIEPRTYLAGASGGVYALITAHIGTIFMNWKEMEFPIIQLSVFLLIVTMDVGTSIYNRYYLNLSDNIGYAAHFGGATAGLLLGLWILKNFVPTKRETYVWWCALTVFVTFMGAMVVMNIVWIDHFPSNSVL